VTMKDDQGQRVHAQQQFYVLDQFGDGIILGHRFFLDNFKRGADLSYRKQCLYYQGRCIPWWGSVAKAEQVVKARATVLAPRCMSFEKAWVDGPRTSNASGVCEYVGRKEDEEFEFGLAM